MSQTGGSGNRWEPGEPDPVTGPDAATGVEAATGSDATTDREAATSADTAADETPGPVGTTTRRSRRRELGLLGGLAAACLLGGGVGGYALAPGGADAAQPDRPGVNVGPGRTDPGRGGPGASELGQPPGWGGHRHDDGDADAQEQGRRT